MHVKSLHYLEYPAYDQTALHPGDLGNADNIFILCDSDQSSPGLHPIWSNLQAGNIHV